MKDVDHFRNKYGEWAVITGASSGIGKSLAQVLAEKKLNLVLIARRQNSLEKLSTTLSAEHGITVKVIAVDLTSSEAIETINSATTDLQVGLLVCSAGFGSSGLFLDSAINTEKEMLKLNCRSPLELSYLFGKRFASQKHGGIILLSSIVAFQGVPHSANYAATKAYVQAFAEALHVELGDFGIDVISAAPGPVHSGFAERAHMKYGMAQQPDVVAKAIIAKLGRKSTVRPGPIAKLLGYSLSTLPRTIRVRLMSQIMSGMAVKQN